MEKLGRISLWGDSVMKGVLWNKETQRYKLSDYHAAEEASEELGFSLHNHSKMGCTSTKGLTLIRHFLDKKEEKPQYAVIEFGGNDCDFNWSEVAAAPDAEHLPNTPLPEFEAQMRSMIHCLREKGIKPVLTTLVPNHAERYFAFITRNGLSGERILRWLGDVQHIYRWHERYNARVEKVAREEDCPVLDLREAFLNQWHYEDFLCEDGIHPNDRGYHLIEQTLCREGRRLLTC